MDSHAPLLVRPGCVCVPLQNFDGGVLLRDSTLCELEAVANIVSGCDVPAGLVALHVLQEEAVTWL